MEIEGVLSMLVLVAWHDPRVRFNCPLKDTTIAKATACTQTLLFFNVSFGSCLPGKLVLDGGGGDFWGPLGQSCPGFSHHAMANPTCIARLCKTKQVTI